jgi:hypothetical protein
VGNNIKMPKKNLLKVLYQELKIKMKLQFQQNRFIKKKELKKEIKLKFYN